MVSALTLHRLIVGLLLGAAMMTSAAAHRVDLSAGQGQLVGDTFTFSIQLSSADAQRILPQSANIATIDRSHFAAVRPYLLAFAAQAWEVRTDGAVAPPVDVQVALLTGATVSFRLSFLRLGARTISLRARHLAQAPANSQELVTIESANGASSVEKMLSAADDSLAFEVSPLGELIAPSTAHGRATTAHSTARSFLWLGIEHIWTGYDHLLFLFGLLLVCRRFRSIVSIVSCFTVAHSLTLATATLGLVRLSSAITEPAIAATIVFVSIENLVRRGQEPKGRWAVTFLFGLIHGFGFATVLRDLGVGENGTSIALPLFTFNLGVELGQIAIAGAVLPLLWHWRRNEWFVRVGVPVLSALSAGAGIVWFLQRTVFA